MLAAALALGVAGCGSDEGGDSPAEGAAPSATAAPKQAVKVDVKSFKFKPDPIKVRVGGTVTFVNRDKAPHTAQTDLSSKRSEFDTGRLELGDEQVVTLKETGRFEYFCVYHRFMEGTVEVVE